MTGLNSSVASVDDKFDQDTLDIKNEISDGIAQKYEETSSDSDVKGDSSDSDGETKLMKDAGRAGIGFGGLPIVNNKLKK